MFASFYCSASTCCASPLSLYFCGIMPLCVGFASTSCPLEAWLGAGKSQCRMCKLKEWELSEKKEEIWGGCKLCDGGCGAQIRFGKRTCRACAQPEKKNEIWDGCKLCDGGCGAQIRVGKTTCRACAQPEASAPADGFKFCPGADAKTCPNGSQILLRNTQCKVCGEDTWKRTFRKFLEDDEHCGCRGCSGCDHESWRPWLEADKIPSLSKIYCSRPLSKKAKTEHLCAFCR